MIETPWPGVRRRHRAHVSRAIHSYVPRPGRFARRFPRQDAEKWVGNCSSDVRESQGPGVSPSSASHNLTTLPVAPTQLALPPNLLSSPPDLPGDSAVSYELNVPAAVL